MTPNSRLYATSLPLALLASVSTYGSGTEFFVSVQYLLANILAFMVVGIVYVFSKGWVKPIGNSVLFPIIAFGALLGFAKQVSTALFVVFLDLEPSLFTSLASRSLTPFLGIWFAVAMSVFSATQVRFGQIREELIAERVRLSAREIPDSAIELKQFADEVAGLISKADAFERNELGALIRSIVNKKLRPLSHDLWDSEQRRTKGFGTRELAQRALQEKPYQVFWVSIILAMSSVQPLANLSSTNLPATYLFLVLATPVALLLANWLRRRFDFAKRQFGGVLVLTSLLAAAMPVPLVLGYGVNINPLLSLTSAWWIGTLIVVTGILSVALEEGEAQREMLRKLTPKEIESEALASMRGVRNRDLANLLHAKTQNQLLAQAVRIEAGGDIESELRQLRDFLNNLPSSNLDDPSLEELIGQWDGIIKVQLDIDQDPTPIQIRAIEEAISNSYRHGLANQVEIELKSGMLRVRDNGLGVVAGKPGLGTSLYSSLGEFSMTSLKDGGSMLEIRLRN